MSDETADEAAEEAAAEEPPKKSGAMKLVLMIVLPLLVLASNSVWLAELVLPAMLLWQRTRVLGAVASALFVFSIQLVARETMFALLYSQLALLVLPGRGYRRIAPVYVVAYAYLVGYLLGILPADWLTKRGGL